MFKDRTINLYENWNIIKEGVNKRMVIACYECDDNTSIYEICKFLTGLARNRDIEEFKKFKKKEM